MPTTFFSAVINHLSSRVFGNRETPLPGAPQTGEENDLWRQYLAVSFENKSRYYIFRRLSDHPLGAAILALGPEEQTRFVRAAADYIAHAWTTVSLPGNLWPNLMELLGRKLPLTSDDLVSLCELGIRTSAYPQMLPIIRALEWASSQPITDARLRASLAALIAKISQSANTPTSSDLQQQINRLRTLLGQDDVKITFAPGKAWADTAAAYVKDHAAWAELIHHCASAKGAKATAKWLKAAAPLLVAVGVDEFNQALRAWLPALGKPYTHCPRTGRELSEVERWNIADVNADILKGLLWVSSTSEDHELAATIKDYALITYRKIPGLGPYNVSAGNACVWALGQMPGTAGVAQLALLKLKVKQGSVQKSIEKALQAAAQRLQLSAAEVEELCVPTYGLTAVGVHRETLGEFAAELTVTGTDDVELIWRKADGKTQASVPKAVKDDHKAALKDLQLAVKEIATMLPAQRDRIENFYLEQAQWPFATWRERYLDHPLLGTLARRLLWRFTHADGQFVTGIWHAGALMNHAGQALTALDSTQVSLWHPLDEATERVLAWREWLAAREIRQPFKQAHREIYVLTAAEENTHVYSNRFAAHILRQHQFNALCHQRYWKNSLRLCVDDTTPPAQRLLSKWQLRAEYWIDGYGAQYGTDTNNNGTFLYVSTDQVRFYAIDAPENFAQNGTGVYSQFTRRDDGTHAPLPLAEIPPLVFSEIMRDVDLFTGVASVTNDPHWLDSGVDGRQRDYWQGVSFGELTASASTRKAVLERLIPRLKIAERCSFSDRFLIVRGALRTYKIHFGSANILMEPNDRYLCIVPSRSAVASAGKQDRIFLPFEGDNVLAIILSKAFMLADDRAITDPMITRQIR